MRKLNSKKKIISCVALVLIAVIVAIIVTTNIVRNGQVLSEGYLATANADSNVVANYIKKGVTIGGITGALEVLNTFDATAYAQDITYGKIAYARGERIVGTRGISENVSYVGYYADIEGDGTVDGVIFADLAIGGSGTWFSDWGVYEIPKETNLKSYYIINESYTDDFGTAKVIAPIDGTNGNDRFYVMALDDFDNKNHYWYYKAYGKLNNQVGNSVNDFGQGRTNTITMIDQWNNEALGKQNSNDIWGLIQDEVDKGWFVPSKSEWSAFRNPFGGESDGDFGLRSVTWTSSQSNKQSAYVAYVGGMSHSHVNGYDETYNHYLRLCTTF